MDSITSHKLATHIAGILDLSVPDIAINGLQVENTGAIRKVITAVDFSEELLKKAIYEQADAIIVHHGIYWGKLFPVTGRYYRLFHGLIKNNIALYGYHLPLDIHPQIGNNALILKAFQANYHSSFGDYKGVAVIMAGEMEEISWNNFLSLYRKKVGEPLAVIVPDNPDLREYSITRVGVCTGGGLFGLEEAHRQGCDVYITGDAGHTFYHPAKELGLPLICGGHYNTEVLGIKTLGEKLAKTLGLAVKFIDIPTGL